MQEAIRTFGAAAAGVRMLSPDGGILRTVAVGGFDDALARPGGASTLDDDDAPTVAALASTWLFEEDQIQVETRHPAAARLPRAWPGLGALAALPLQLDERIVGVLGLRFLGTRDFPAAERNTLRAFARMAAMSLVRAGLHESEARRRAHADLLADVSATLDAELGPRRTDRPAPRAAGAAVGRRVRHHRAEAPTGGYRLPWRRRSPRSTACRPPRRPPGRRARTRA